MALAWDSMSIDASDAYFDPGSFRDPDSSVFWAGGRVYRYFSQGAAVEFDALAKSGLLDSLMRKNLVISTKIVAPDDFAHLGLILPKAFLVTEHPRLPFISYPYEWSFDMLKDSAFLYLELLKMALDEGFILKDATPYNIQFMGPRPIFIDVASFERREEGMPWPAYTQFCRTFLNPLLLQARLGVRFNGWMRSSLDGIAPEDLSRMLPFRHKLNKTVFLNVVLQAWLNRRFARVLTATEMRRQRQIRKKEIQGLVGSLQRSITRLKKRSPESLWISYEEQNIYDPQSRACKEAFVERSVAAAKPEVVWDLGCNVGAYSVIAARHAHWVIAMDNDADTINALYNRAKGKYSNILPLVIDLFNPSPDQGWAQEERIGLLRRGPADFVLALALLHHLAISGNIPIKMLVAWLARITRNGVIEFVPKTDPMVRELLRWRKDIFDAYSKSAFEAALTEQFRVLETAQLPNGRILYAFAK